VGAGGIGLNISGRLTLRKYDDLGLVLIAMTLTIMALEAAARYARRKLVTG
jgi:ABC-type phosphate/phosphonate transport system permease subunit